MINYNLRMIIEDVLPFEMLNFMGDYDLWVIMEDVLPFEC